jgi:hypothetical protein
MLRNSDFPSFLIQAGTTTVFNTFAGAASGRFLDFLWAPRVQIRDRDLLPPVTGH